jgi:hypothetical protein
MRTNIPAASRISKSPCENSRRQLTDAGKMMEFEQREAVDRVRKLASDISDQLVKMMLAEGPQCTQITGWRSFAALTLIGLSVLAAVHARAAKVFHRR